jgi:hypothetical protein
MVGPRGAFVSLGAPCSHRPSIFRVVWFLAEWKMLWKVKARPTLAIGDHGQRPWATSWRAPNAFVPYAFLLIFFYRKGPMAHAPNETQREKRGRRTDAGRRHAVT